MGGESKSQALVHFFQFSMFFNGAFVSQVFCGCLQTAKEKKIFKCCNPSAGGIEICTRGGWPSIGQCSLYEEVIGRKSNFPVSGILHKRSRSRVLSFFFQTCEIC